MTLRDVAAIIKEVMAVVRAALVGWPETARLCIILAMAATTAWIILSVLR
jgi:hypothetical protein